MSQHRRALLVAPVAALTVLGVVAALPSGAAEPYSAQGTATAPAMTSATGFGVTDTGFLSACPDPDANPAQGVDGWVFALPAGSGGATATVVGSDGADVEAFVYSTGCEYLVTEAGVESGVVLPANAGFLSVYSTDTPEVTFDLTVVEGADPTPTGTATPTATTTTAPPSDPGPLRTRHTYSASPNDPLYNEVPFLVEGTSAGTGQWGMQKVRAAEAWQRPRATGAGVQVGVLDSGLDLGHPDLSCEGKVRIAPGATPDGTLPTDLDGHGSHVAGIIGACTDNGEGVVGVAPDATLVPFRVLGADGGTAEDLQKAIVAATDAGVHVINMSIGFSAQGAPGSGSAAALIGAYAETIDKAIAYAVSKGVVVVSTSGNETFPLCGYPALADDVLCVGATDRRDLPAFYSNFALKADGGAPGEGHSMVAPGGSGQIGCDLNSENILSTYSRELDGCAEGAAKGYEGLDGTSMAAPHVAGAAALVYDRLGAVRSPENAAKVIEALTESAVDLGAPGWDPQFGSGRLDVVAAVEYVEPVVDPTPTATATPSATATVTPPRATTLTLSAPASGQRTDALPVQVTLEDATGAPVAGATVQLSLGDATRTLTTGADGTASATEPLDGEPGTYELAATYAGTATTLPSGAHQPVAVMKEDTTATVVVTGGGAKQTVTGTLVDKDTPTAGVAGVTLLLVDDKGATTSAVTDAQGRATWTPTGGAKSRTWTVRFAGDARWLASSAST